jgi:hypothetical protein
VRDAVASKPVSSHMYSRKRPLSGILATIWLPVSATSFGKPLNRMACPHRAKRDLAPLQSGLRLPGIANSRQGLSRLLIM